MPELNSPDPISELDLMAYVDDQLDPERRIAVEDHLSRKLECSKQAIALDH